MKIGTEKPIPLWIRRKMPCGITRLNTLNYPYYGIIGLDRKKRDWYSGMFMELIFDWYEADYILDLKRNVYWRTGKNNAIAGSA